MEQKYPKKKKQILVKLYEKRPTLTWLHIKMFMRKVIHGETLIKCKNLTNTQRTFYNI